MLRALAFVAVREQQDESGEEVPLVFAGDDELVDDDLRAVGEVAELGFPHDERFGEVAGEAVLEAEDRGFGELGVVDFDARLAGSEVTERDVFLLVDDVDEHASGAG